MSAWLEALGGAASASGLGRVFDWIDTPRRATWEALGLPGTGHELMTSFGMDPDSPWTTALGIGSEMLLDPLNLVGAGLGKAVGRGARVLAGAASPWDEALGAAKGLAKGEEGWFDLDEISKALGRDVSSYQKFGPGEYTPAQVFTGKGYESQLKQFTQPELDALKAWWENTMGLPTGQHQAALDSAIAKSALPHDMILYRGAMGLGPDTADSIRHAMRNPATASDLVGTVYQSDRVMPTSFIPGQYYQAGAQDPRSLAIDIVAPRGTRAAPVFPFSDFDEGELLLGRNQPLRVAAVKNVAPGPGGTHVDDPQGPILNILLEALGA